MKKLTMKDFRWLGKPQQWEKTYKDLSLTVEGMLCMPDGPLLLAVSDENFTLSLTSTVAPEGGSCGVCLYHTEANYLAVGRSKSGILVETVVHSYKTKAEIALPTGDECIQWILERKGQEMRIGYLLEPAGLIEWVCTSAMPGMEGAISFGVFFSNHTDTAFEAGIHGIRYSKNDLQTLHPLV